MTNSSLRRTGLAVAAALSLGTATESAAAHDEAALSVAIGDLQAPLTMMAQLSAESQVPPAACAAGDDVCRLQAAEDAVAARPQDARARYDLGFELFRNRKYDRSIAELGESIALNPKNFDAFFMRGRAYSNRAGDGDAKRAVADFTKALALKPSDVEALYYRGNAHWVDKNWTSAIGDYTRTLALDPKYPGAHLMRGICRQNLQDYPGAMKDFDEGIAVKPDSGLYWHRAELHDLMGNPAAAAADRKQADALREK